MAVNHMTLRKAEKQEKRKELYKNFSATRKKILDEKGRRKYVTTDMFESFYRNHKEAYEEMLIKLNGIKNADVFIGLSAPNLLNKTVDAALSQIEDIKYLMEKYPPFFLLHKIIMQI